MFRINPDFLESVEREDSTDFAFYVILRLLVEAKISTKKMRDVYEMISSKMEEKADIPDLTDILEEKDLVLDVASILQEFVDYNNVNEDKNHILHFKEESIEEEMKKNIDEMKRVPGYDKFDWKVDFFDRKNTKILGPELPENISSFDSNDVPSWMITMLMDFGLTEDSSMLDDGLRMHFFSQPYVNFRNGRLELMEQFEKVYEEEAILDGKKIETTEFLCMIYGKESVVDNNEEVEVERRIFNALNHSFPIGNDRNKPFTDSHSKASEAGLGDVLKLYKFLVSL